MARIYPNSRPSSKSPPWPKRKPADVLYVMLCKACAALDLPEPEPEYSFHPTRKWRFDLAWPGVTAEDYQLTTDFSQIRKGLTVFSLAIEIQGGTHTHGKHSRGAGQRNDYEKNNEAVALGWRVLYVSTDMISSQPKRRQFVSFVLSILMP